MIEKHPAVALVEEFVALFASTPSRSITTELARLLALARIGAAIVAADEEAVERVAKMLERLVCDSDAEAEVSWTYDYVRQDRSTQTRAVLAALSHTED